MESLLFSSEQLRTGAQTPASVSLSGALLQSLLKGIDFKSGLLCEATVINQQGKNCTLQIRNQIITAELPTAERMPEKVMLRFISTGVGPDPVISMQITGREALRLKSYVLDTNPGKLSAAIKIFLPSLTESQAELLFKLLPYFREDFHENLASFAYLLGLDEEKLQAHILEQRGDRITPRELGTALEETGNILGSCPTSELTEDERNILENTLKIIDTMQRKIKGAKNLCQFIDEESAPLGHNMKLLIHGPEATAAHREGAAEGKESLQSPLSVNDGKELQKGADRHMVLDYISREASLDRLMDRTFKTNSPEWSTAFAWKTADESQILKGLTVEERKQGTGTEIQREYQVSFRISLPSVGDMTCILYWMKHSISCRIVCESIYSHFLFELNRALLEERFKERGISCLNIKVEHGG